MVYTAKKVEVGEPATELNKAFVEAAHFQKTEVLMKQKLVSARIFNTP